MIYVIIKALNHSSYVKLHNQAFININIKNIATTPFIGKIFYQFELATLDS